MDQAAYAAAVQYNLQGAAEEVGASILKCFPASAVDDAIHQVEMPKKKRSVNPQSEENFIKALDAVRNGGIGFCKAARMYGVNNRTLWLEYKKRGYPNFRLSIKNRKTDPPGDGSAAMDENADCSQKTHASDDAVGERYEDAAGGPSEVAVNAPIGYFDKHVDFGQMIHRMNAAALMASQQQQQNAAHFQTINFEQIN
ncbi:hypothetical protein WA026_014731 [Henosepilachna vigintioctopunctata]|uniref:HTH psq-type domain-containing protein n=1 Tax=Henosepilachna vigintioctopunctata TaxID=420089 RepID=A0AAW1VGZ0_9CUCU